jgi:hypothetical protein
MSGQLLQWLNMNSKYYKWIMLGLVFAVITAISFWGISGFLVVIIVDSIYFWFCLPVFILCLIIWGKLKKKNKKYPSKMTYLYWSNENGRPVAKVIREQEQKNEKNPSKIKQ